LHIGHIRYFEAARQFGDRLFVTVSPDRFVDKGPNRPAFTERLRAEALAALDMVDAVAVNEWPTAVELLRLLRPDVYVKGSDFKSAEADPTGKLQQEAEACRELGIELRFTEEIVFSSTSLINRFLADYPEELREFLALFRRRHTLSEVLAVLEAMSKLRVLLVGDTILDDYCYCSVLGLSSKYPAITVKRGATDTFPGGILAIANHVAQFTARVDLLTVLGKPETAWAEASLAPAVRPHFFFSASETMRKLRYFEAPSFAKLLEVYNTDETAVPPEEEEAYLGRLEPLAAENDFILAADFGHGAITPRLRRFLCDEARFLAVNTQCNAGNNMMNTISQYDRADYVSITEGELRRDRHDRRSHLRALTVEAARRLRARYFVTTRGRHGLCVGQPDGWFIESPALTIKTTDTVGAGDAVLSLGALAAYVGAPVELVALFGNAAGALAAQTIGNSAPVTRPAFEKFITSLLK